MRKLIPLLLCCASFAAFAADQDPGPTIELEKTATAFSFEAKFPGRDGTYRFKVQDGAMAMLAVEGQEPLRFIMKQHGPSDIRLSMVKQVSFLRDGKLVPGLKVGKGVNVYSGNLPEEMVAAGVSQVSLTKIHPKGVKKSAGTGNEGPAALFCETDDGCEDESPNPAPVTAAADGAPPAPMSCCTFTACGGKSGTVRGTGPTCGGDECGGDDCGGCCTG